jgi:tyrosyl-tRNA synthetase
MASPMSISGHEPIQSQELLEDLAWRGLIQDVSDREGLAEALANGPITLYVGYDPTASSLHVGNLQIILLQRRFQLAGHRVIALSGGGTGLIGDPSGKEGERALTDEETVARWTRAIREQLERLLPRDSETITPAIFEDNSAWIRPLSTVELLRDIGKHFPLGSMLSKESVASRLHDADRGISFTEFAYMVLQAYDFQVLYDTYDCRLQIGGSDQWGNVTAGLELLRRTQRRGAFGMTAPLILRPDGTKFGKSEAGAIWLDRTRTSPFAFYQHFLNVPDSEIGMLLRRLSLRPREEIVGLEEATERDPSARHAQRALAEELTVVVHGDSGLAEAREATDWLFGDGQLRPDADVGSMFAGAPAITVDPDDWSGWEHKLVEAELASSRSDARRTIAGGGVYINDRRISSDEATLSPSDFSAGGVAVLRKGKRHRALVRLA